MTLVVSRLCVQQEASESIIAEGDAQKQMMKLTDIWFYHKFKITIIAAVAIAVVLVVKANHMGTETDIDIAYKAGKWINYSDVQALLSIGWYIEEDKLIELQEYVSKNIKDINGDKKKEVSINPIGDKEIIDLEFAAPGCQFIMLDLDNLKLCMLKDAFESLDGYIDKYDIDLDEHPEVTMIAEGMTQAHTYAIPIENMPFLIGIGFPSKEYYCTIRTANKENGQSVKKNENAHILLDALINMHNNNSM